MSIRVPAIALALTVAAAIAWPAAPGTVSAQAPAAISLIINNGIVVTVDGDRRVLNPGAVAINGTDIVAIDTPAAIASRYKAAQTLDAQARW